MKSDINLISLNQAELIKEGRVVRLLRKMAVISICIVGLSSLILFLIIQSISPSEIRKQKIEIEQNLAAQNTKEAMVIVVGRKIKDIKNIINKRPKYEAIISDITQAIPENVSVSNLEVNDVKLGLAVTSNSSLSLN